LNKDNLIEKAWFKEWTGQRLEFKDGIIYHYQAKKRTRLQQIQTRAVPTAFGPTILAACHTSPMLGHTDKTKTYATATRYWWPNMTRDIAKFVKSYAYCKLTNATSHEAQSILQAIETQAPFDVLFLGVWTPGDFPSKWGELKVLTCLEGMSSFAEAAFVNKADSTTVSRAAMA
jgi:hypothetical protein